MTVNFKIENSSNIAISNLAFVGGITRKSTGPREIKHTLKDGIHTITCQDEWARLQWNEYILNSHQKNNFNSHDWLLTFGTSMWELSDIESAQLDKVLKEYL